MQLGDEVVNMKLSKVSPKGCNMNNLQCNWGMKIANMKLSKVSPKGCNMNNLQCNWGMK
jgi:hypothetical protein